MRERERKRERRVEEARAMATPSQESTGRSYGVLTAANVER